MIIKRHNQATWDISSAISTGERGNDFTIIDAGIQVAAEDDDHWDELPDISNDEWDDSPDLDCPQAIPEGRLGEAPLSANPDPTAASAYQPSQDYEDSHDPLNCPEDIDGHKGARIPEWMLPEIGDDLRNKLRPDILRISGLPCTTVRTPQSRHERQRLSIHILEIGFCSDTRWEEKLHKKRQQHTQLTHLLREAGWRVVEPHILLFGVGGTVFEQTLQSLRSFGVTREDAHKCLLKIHTRSALWVDKLVKLRRHHAQHNVALNIGIT